jgi:hypothetical protein
LTVVSFLGIAVSEELAGYIAGALGIWAASPLDFHYYTAVNLVLTHSAEYVIDTLQSLD